MDSKPEREIHEVDRLTYKPMHNYRTVDVDAWAYQWFSGFNNLDPESDDFRAIEPWIHGTLFLHPEKRESDARDLRYGMYILSLIGSHNPHDPNATSPDEQRQYTEWEKEHQLAQLIGRQIVRNILEDAEKYAAIRVEREQSGTDYLTHLPNRLGLRRKLSEWYGISDDPVRRSPHGASLPPIRILHVYADLNQFKWINDTLGHHVGDAAIVEASWRAQDVFRISESPIIYRHGGDEFGAILGDLSDRETAQITQRLMTRQFDRVTGATFIESMQAIKERVEAIRTSGKRVRAEARQDELTRADIASGKRPHYVVYINGDPVTELDNIVSFSVGLASGTASSYDDIERLRRSAELEMERIKPVLHDIIVGKTTRAAPDTTA